MRDKIDNFEIGAEKERFAKLSPAINSLFSSLMYTYRYIAL
jgi:hypothetical protein